MEDDFECEKCGELCQIDGESPRFFAWCHFCQDYAMGFDETDHAAERAAGIADGHENQEGPCP